MLGRRLPGAKGTVKVKHTGWDMRYEHGVETEMDTEHQALDLLVQEANRQTGAQGAE